MNNSYTDEDLVYVDPKTRTVIGPVEWSKSGKPVSLERKEEEAEEEPEEKGRKRRKRKKRYYPWGTYRTMKRIYRIEGKEKQDEEYISLDEAIRKSLQEPFWD